jgi:hypothetical protein
VDFGADPNINFFTSRWYWECMDSWYNAGGEGMFSLSYRRLTPSTQLLLHLFIMADHYGLCFAKSIKQIQQCIEVHKGREDDEGPPLCLYAMWEHDSTPSGWSWDYMYSGFARKGILIVVNASWVFDTLQKSTAHHTDLKSSSLSQEYQAPAKPEVLVLAKPASTGDEQIKLPYPGDNLQKLQDLLSIVARQRPSCEERACELLDEAFETCFADGQVISTEEFRKMESSWNPPIYSNSVCNFLPEAQIEQNSVSIPHRLSQDLA